MFLKVRTYLKSIKNLKKSVKFDLEMRTPLRCIGRVLGTSILDRFGKDFGSVLGPFSDQDRFRKPLEK